MKPIVKARNRTNCDELLQPGDYCFTGIYGAPVHAIGGMIVACPGCGGLSALSFANSPGAEPGKTWTWDGDHDAPTLTPSVWMKNECGWHGYLTKGEWRPC